MVTVLLIGLVIAAASVVAVSLSDVLPSQPAPDLEGIKLRGGEQEGELALIFTNLGGSSISTKYLRVIIEGDGLSQTIEYDNLIAMPNADVFEPGGRLVALVSENFEGKTVRAVLVHKSSGATLVSATNIVLPALPPYDKLTPTSGSYTGAFVVEWYGDPATGDYEWEHPSQIKPEPLRENIREFESIAQKELSVVLGFANWAGKDDGSVNFVQFPRRICEIIREEGAIPYITWQPQIWTASGIENIPLDNIIAGQYDDYIRNWAHAARKWRYPLFLRFAHEMNGDWYCWSGSANGGGTLNGYGDPTKPDGPERYVDAWRHVYNIFLQENALNVTWIWSPYHRNIPNETWNRWQNYYPGHAYVDWIGVDGFNWGEGAFAGSQWESFSQVFLGFYTGWIENLNENFYIKPLMLAEFACSEEGAPSEANDKDEWIADTFSELRENDYEWAGFDLFAWFHIDKERDWRIHSDNPSDIEASQNVENFRMEMSNTYYVSSIQERVPYRETNVAPSKPSQLSWPSSGTTQDTLQFQVRATDGDGDKIKYFFDWGDGFTVTPYFNSGAVVTVSHRWAAEGTYTIRVRAIDERGAASDWSENQVTITAAAQPVEYYAVYSDAGFGHWQEGTSKVYTWSDGNQGSFDAEYTGETPPEGSKCFETKTNAGSWAGWGYYNPEDLSAYAGGDLKFWVKTPANLKVEIQDTTQTHVRYINNYGWDGNNTWQDITIPLDDFEADLSAIEYPFKVTIETSGTFYVDNVRWVRYA